MALADTLMALDAGNLAAAQAHSERMKLAENMVPWLVGPCDTMITARIEYQTNALALARAGAESSNEATDTQDETKH